jgi:hypothetical protein
MALTAGLVKKIIFRLFCNQPGPSHVFYLLELLLRNVACMQFKTVVSELELREDDLIYGT